VHRRSEKKDQAGLGTRAVWAGEGGKGWEGATQIPVALSVSFGYQSVNEWLAVARGKSRGHIYSRNTNPTVAVFEEKVRDLESAEAATSFSSGMAAISNTLFALLSSGDRIVSIKDTYGGTNKLFIEFLPRFGIEVSLCDTGDHDAIEAEIGQASGIVGRSPAIRRLLDLIDRLAPRDTTVLITGESGTGKELIARALHDKSLRRERPFIAVNCAALSETLFESELFGHEKGAFTGAISLKRGRFELAEGGTIFLDEVGELALSLQAKLLRVLQQREFERVGGTHPHPLDIRIIAATNRDLADDVREGRFREDLYHRLNVVTLNSPPLREHADDILLLANYFLERSAKRCKRQIVGISPEASELLVHYSWPGNVRELENAMERAVVLGVSDRVLPEDLPEGLLETGTRDASARYHLSVGHAKREAILEAYAQGNWDYKQAARTLGLHPNYLLRLVRNLGLREELNRLQAGGAAR